LSQYSASNNWSLAVYVPPHYAETRTDALHRLIAHHPLAALVTHGPHGLDANHLPFEFDATKGEHGTLIAHVARANPVWKEVANGSPVLVIFKASDNYISPNWYPSKHEAHRQVPTWNYQVVHAHGNLTVHDDERFVRGVVARLTRTHEASESKPWKMGDSAPDFIDQMVKAIVGIEIEVVRLVGKSKLSQNKEARDRDNAATELDKRGNHTLAQAMRATIEK
jgi:transcriptional regulator